MLIQLLMLFFLYRHLDGIKKKTVAFLYRCFDGIKKKLVAIVPSSILPKTSIVRLFLPHYKNRYYRTVGAQRRKDTNIASCPICLNGLHHESSSDHYGAPPCGHVAHKTCYYKWIMSFSTTQPGSSQRQRCSVCPVCKSQVSSTMDDWKRVYISTTTCTIVPPSMNETRHHHDDHFSNLEDDLQNVIEKYTRLLDDNISLQNEYRGTLNQQTSLQETHIQLQNDHISLQDKHSTLQDQLLSLIEQHSSLQTQHIALQSAYETLLAQQVQVLGEKIKELSSKIKIPPAIAK